MAIKSKSEPSRRTNRHKAKRLTKTRPAWSRHGTYHGPPKGYVYVPKGDVYITRKCTTLTQEGDQEVHIVHNRNATRIGLYVPEHVWKQVLSEAAQTAEKREEAIRRKDDRDAAKTKTLLRKRYPNMPCSDLETILNHAFMKGSGRVGRTSRHSVERRASLAVGAHVRHKYTAYDEMLNRRGMSRGQARDLVWKTVSHVKLGWTRKLSQEPTRIS